MAGYDPQSRRPRPSLPTDSPVDGLLDAEVPVEAADPTDDAPTEDRVAEVPAPDADGQSDEGLRPFEAPPIEMTDERADLLHRLGALAAVAALVAVLLFWRRRRRGG